MLAVIARDLYYLVRLVRGSSMFMAHDMMRAHSPTFPSLHLRHNSFSNPSVGLPTSQLSPQPFGCFTYVTVHSPTLLSLLLRHKLFTYVIWRAAHGLNTSVLSYFDFLFPECGSTVSKHPISRIFSMYYPIRVVFSFIMLQRKWSYNMTSLKKPRGQNVMKSL